MRIVIAGAGAVGGYLAKLLSQEGIDCVLIDEDEARLSNLSGDYDIMTMVADPCSIRTLKEAGVKDCDLFVGVTNWETMNLACCSLAKKIGAQKTVARIDNYEHINPKFQPEHKNIFDQLGIDSLIYPEVLAARDIINGLQTSWARQRWDVSDGSLVMLGVKLRDNKCELLNQPLRNLIGPSDPYHVVAIKRGTETIIPGGNDQLLNLDLVYFMVEKDALPILRKKVGKEDYADVKNVIIMGGSKTAVRVAQTLPENMSAKIIELDEKRCDRLNDIIDNDNVMIINGDGRDVGLLKEEGLEKTQAFVALTGNTEANILSCLSAKRMGVRKTVAMVQNFDYVTMAESLDLGTLVNKQTIAASHIYQMMLNTNVSNLQSLMMANAQVAEFEACEGSKVTRKPVKDLQLPYGCTIGGLDKERCRTACVWRHADRERRQGDGVQLRHELRQDKQIL